ncbi:hypothetical protein HDU76_007291 [Blyttiomyces sp. JEL0837]|nr:hypothetical protein HDU76_007291 [Blyttiomyces sp. JEL0837]
MDSMTRFAVSSPAPEVSSYNPLSDELFQLDEQYTSDCGLRQQALLLFPRKAFRDQMAKLKSLLHDKRKNSSKGQNPYTYLWILGPPGTGKSTTTLAFLSTIDRCEWTITFIHLMGGGDYECAKYCGATKYGINPINSKDDNLKMLLEDEHGKKHIVFLDGVIVGDNPDIKVACQCWLRSDFDRHRLVVTSSMSSRGKANKDDDDKHGIEEFFVDSWQLDEYVAAVQHENFFRRVEHNLDASIAMDTDKGDKVEMLKSKHYFAGGSSRFMFDYSTPTVVEQLNGAVAAVSDVVPYITATSGDLANGVINRLFSRVVIKGVGKTGIISQYAASALAVQGGPSLVQNISNALQEMSNPWMNGWFLEMWFFANLQHGGLKLYVRPEDLNPIAWPQSTVNIFNPDDLSAGFCMDTWLKPIKWNQGGYDAVFVDSKCGLVRFVQVTSKESHSLKLEYFHSLLSKKIVQANDTWVTQALEICFIVPKSLEEFRVGAVTGEVIDTTM